jgi:inner membrane protein
MVATVPSAITHAVAAAAIGSIMVPGRRGLIALGAICSAVPDADVVGFRFGISYGDLLGHRGLTHSIAFAALLAAAVTWVGISRRGQPVATDRLYFFLFLATVSHGLLDALTNGGLGVAFFAPFSADRFFFPWRPIVVSPISIRRFFSGGGLAVIASELFVVWIPATAIWLAGRAVRHRRERYGPPPARG